MDDKIIISNDVIISANCLRNNNLQKRFIKDLLTDILRRINHELLIAHKEGKHNIITSIPITYTIPNMSNKDSQRVIWSNIIDVLNSKNYRTWISPNKDVCRMKITWISSEDEVDIKYQTNLIAKHTKNI